MDNRYPEIDKVLKYIHEHLFEHLPLERLAKYAVYSPYHFSRIFKETTGLSPLYYVSSVRLQKAKDLLLNTNLSVRDISLEIGQQSLGTFTTRFTERVGITPAEFRHSTVQTKTALDSLQNLSDWPSSSQHKVVLPNLEHLSLVEGTVQTEFDFRGFILIGLFTKPIPEGLPLYGTLLSSVGTFRFIDVLPGTYYLMATTVSWEMKAKDILLPITTLRCRLKEPIIIKSDSSITNLQVDLHPPRLDDPPILISLPVLMNNFLSRVQQISNQEEIYR